MKNNLNEKLALNEKVNGSYEQMLEIARQGLLKFGKLSIYYLMRKLKCNKSMACKIMKDLQLPI
jgi:hypothetical protein